MPHLYCDLGEGPVWCGLGDGPLEFDEDGRAFVEDDAAAERIVATHQHIHDAGRHPDDQPSSSDEGGDDGTEEAFDADEFVDRTPMDDVVDDIESGDYDDHLDAIADAAGRNGVLDALEARRDAQEE